MAVDIYRLFLSSSKGDLCIEINVEKNIQNFKLNYKDFFFTR